MNIKILTMSSIIASSAIISCNQQGGSSNSAITKDSAAAKSVAIKEEPVTYSVGGKNYDGYVTYDSNQDGKRPAVLVVHEWWGLTDYPRMRAKELASLGYIAMAVDMYGDGKIGPDPKTALELATPSGVSVWQHAGLKP